MIHVRPRRLVAVAAAILALQAVAGTALADTEIYDIDKVGRHSLRDRYVDPKTWTAGAICRYESSTTYTPLMSRLTVRVPNVFAHDATSGTDTQVVGWRPRLEHRAPGAMSWTLVLAPTVQRATATDATRAAFSARVFTAAQIPNDGTIRILVDMYWYGPGATVSGGGTITGRSRHRVDYYQQDFWYSGSDGSGGTTSLQFGSCAARWT